MRRYLNRVRRSEQGGATIVVFAGSILFMILLMGAADLGFLVVCKARAQDAADAAALAAVRESFPLFSSGVDPEEAAGRVARENGARLEELQASASGDRVEVSTSVSLPSLFLGRAGIAPKEITATAAAEIDIRALLEDGRLWGPADSALVGMLYRKGLLETSGELSSLVVTLSLSHLGKPYVWGASGPNAFDCSGLVWYVYSRIGLSLPRVTYSQVRIGRPVGPGDLLPGDLVFFRNNAHVGIYLGGGYYVHAPRTGDVVKVSSLGSRSDLSACRRVL